MPTHPLLRPLQSEDRTWLAERLTAVWGASSIVSRGVLHDAGSLPGFVAEEATGPVGAVTYHLEHADCQLVTIDAVVPGRGIGTALLGAVEAIAAQHGCRRVWLITTNDNLPALRFYQCRGYRLAALYPEAVAAARRLKPQIPTVGNDGIPIRDELELEKRLD